MKHRWLRRIAGGIALLLVGTFVLGAVVMLLWNAVMPQVFGLSMITFWQSVGLLLLSHILLRGWGHWPHGYGWGHARWRRRFAEKIAAMSPEEREQFMKEWEQRCGHRRGQGETAATT